ncbi:MAG: tyrosine-protein phosphatase [Arachidicoccus sp.]|nr:tyrosine-protein phosphatase [Arachidicoccus sp.]
MKKYLIILIAAFPFFGSAQITDSAKREVKLQGAVNFRDLGGYQTKDGKHVKWGKIYRSAALNNLTEEDLQTLENLKIAVDADFRGPYEVSLAPDRIPGNVHRISLPAGSKDAGKPSNLKQMLSAKDKDSGIIAFYSNTSILRDRYKPVFDSLLSISPDSALLFHCSAGKDRTGIGAALVLYVLGVQQETIWNDYLASNYYRRNTIIKDSAQMVNVFHISPDQAKNLAGVKREYLQATYDAINKQYGSLDNFLKQDLGLNNSKIKELRRKYLE